MRIDKDTEGRARAALAVLQLAIDTLERASVEAGSDMIDVRPAVKAISKQSARALRAYDLARLRRPSTTRA
jgi:hypothetical protein